MKGNMHYYQFHIGDYRADTAHLSNDEDLAYRRLLDMYYDTEKPIPLDTQWVARRIRSAPDVVEVVLNDMFERTDEGWRKSRCDKEIEFYRQQAEKNRRNGSKGGRPPQNPVGSQSEPTGKATNNQQPTTINQSSSLKKNKAQALQKPIGVSDEVWQSFLLIRKAKRAPVTDLAMLGIRREAVKAGIELEQALTICCERGWAGFKAEWMQGQQGKPQAESFYERDQRAKRERWEEMTGRKWPEEGGAIIEMNEQQILEAP